MENGKKGQLRRGRIEGAWSTCTFKSLDTQRLQPTVINNNQCNHCNQRRLKIVILRKTEEQSRRKIGRRKPLFKSNSTPPFIKKFSILGATAILQCTKQNDLSKPKEEGAIQVLERISVNQLLTTMWSPPLPSSPFY